MAKIGVDRGRAAVAPIYLFACLVLGGSAQGIWANMMLQLVGLLVIAWSAIAKDTETISRSGRQLLLLAILGLAVVAWQMIPLPPTIWSNLGPRTKIAEGFHVLGIATPAEPLSLTPAAGLSSLFGVIPPLAIVCAMLRLKAFRPDWLAFALIAGTLAGIALGALQVAYFSGQPQSPWYLYQDSNWGKAVGFFANADHMATLLVVTIPFLAAILASAKSVGIQAYSATIALAAGLALLLLVGLALNGSLAGFGLALPVLAASFLILPAASRFRLWVITLAGVLGIAAVIALEASSIGAGTIGEHAATATESRAELVSITSRAAVAFMPFGSGLGSFPSVYPLYENPQEVTDIYAIHAHNDYLEVVLELGLPGLVCMVLFLAWWARGVWGAWRTTSASAFARAAAISSAAVLVHSLVDFPLRTAAVAGCFGMCLALLADHRSAPPQAKQELRPSRHRAIGSRKSF